MIRRILAVAGVLCVYFSADIFLPRNQENAWAKHNLIFRNASDLVTGTVANSLIDASSITKQGNSISIATVSAGLNVLLSTASDLRFAVIFATSELRSNLNVIVTTNAAQIMSAIALSTGALSSNFTAILSTNIRDSSVTGDDIASNTIQGRNVGDSIVMSSHIFNSTILTEDVGDKQITQSKLASNDTFNSVSGINLMPNIVLSSHVALGAIGGNEIGTQTVTNAHLANNTIIGKNIAAKVVLSTHIAGQAIEGWNIKGPILSSHSAISPSSTTLYIQDEGTLVVAGSTLNFIGAGVSVSAGDNGVSSITIAGGGGGGTTYLSTFTVSLAAGGDVFIATTAFVAVPGAFFRVMQDTIVITSAEPFCLHPSTVADTQFSVMRSTETGATNIGYTPIHSSSFTVPVNSHYGSIVTPDAITTIFAREALSLWTTIVPSSGTLPAEYGVTLRYFKRP